MTETKYKMLAIYLLNMLSTLYRNQKYFDTEKF